MYSIYAHTYHIVSKYFSLKSMVSILRGRIQSMSFYFSQNRKLLLYIKYIHAHTQIHLHIRKHCSKWAKIFFSPYSVLYPLKNLAERDSNLEILARAGVICSLARVMNEWAEGRQVSPQCMWEWLQCILVYVYVGVHSCMRVCVYLCMYLCEYVYTGSGMRALVWWGH